MFYVSVLISRHALLPPCLTPMLPLLTLIARAMLLLRRQRTRYATPDAAMPAMFSRFFTMPGAAMSPLTPPILRCCCAPLP